VGRHQRDTLYQLVTVCDKDVAGCMPWGEHGEAWEATTEERVRRVSHLNRLGGFVTWVLEGGIKVCARLIASTMGC
jgi:hypothetical protein